MTAFSVAGRTITLPASLAPKSATDKLNAWLGGEWITVRLEAEIGGIRVHTDGREFSATDVMWERKASQEAGAWAAIGDTILTSRQMVDVYALPGVFTHAAQVRILPGCVVNIGICGIAELGMGGGTQAEHVAGPLFELSRMDDKVWVDRAGRA